MTESMPKPELYVSYIENVKTYIIAMNDKQAAIIHHQKIKCYDKRGAHLGTLERHMVWAQTPQPGSEVWDTYTRFGTGYYGNDGLDDTFYPVNERQYYIDLALEYIEHEAPL